MLIMSFDRRVYKKKNAQAIDIFVDSVSLNFRTNDIFYDGSLIVLSANPR